MNFALSLKTLAVIALVAGSTAAIVRAAPRPADGVALAVTTAAGYPLPSTFH